MPITWSAAVEEANSSDRATRYRRALQQLQDLDPLVRSFWRAVHESQKWPQQDMGNDTCVNMQPAETMSTGEAWRRERHVKIDRDTGSWWLIEYESDHHGRYLGGIAQGVGPRMGKTAADVIAEVDFDAHLDSIEQSKDWVPLQLLGWLQTHGIPVPDDV